MLLNNLLTIEDINGILMTNPSFNKLYEIDCEFLPQTPFNDTYYDFNVISMEIETSGRFKDKYHYIVKVYNKFWDGKVSFKNVPPTEEEPILYTDTIRNYNNELYVLHIFTDYTNFKICLNLDNMNENERQYISPSDTPLNTFNVQLSEEKISFVYSDNKSVIIKALNSKDGGVRNTSITIKYRSIYAIDGNFISGEFHGITDENGEYELTFPTLIPTKYNFRIILSKNNYLNYITNFFVNVKKEKPNIEVINNDGYYGGFVEDEIRITTNGNEVNSFTLRLNNILNNRNKIVKISKENNVFTHKYKQSYRNIHDGNPIIDLTLDETLYTESVSKRYYKNLDYKSIDNWMDLRMECEDNKGTDYIFLSANEMDVGNNPIFINRKIEIIGEEGDGEWCTFKNATNYVFRIGFINYSLEHVPLKIKNIKFSNNYNVIYCNAYSDLEIENCYFTNNTGSGNIGVCIKTKIGDEYTKKNYGNMNLKNCYFYNNRGSNISTSFKTNIYKCRFVLDDWSYAQQTNPYGIEIYGQETDIKYSFFICSMGNEKSPFNTFNYGKSTFKVVKNSIINNTFGRYMGLNDDNNLIFNNNRCYFYAKFEENGEDIIASPQIGRERQSYFYTIDGKRIEIKNFINMNTIYDNRDRKPKVSLPLDSKQNRSLTNE